DHFKSSSVKNIDIKHGNLKLNYHDGQDLLNQSFSGVSILTGEFSLTPGKNDNPLTSKNLTVSVDKYEIESDQANFIIIAENIVGLGSSGKINGSNVKISQKKSRGANQPYF